MKNLSFPGLPRVLIVDDEDSVREGLETLFQQEGLQVETASTAEEGLRCVHSRCYDIVFLDGNMPGAEGLSRISEFRTGSPAPDVLVLSGYGTAPNTVESMRKGASDVIEKPFSSDRILATIRRVLEARQLKNELSWHQERVRQLTATELVGLSDPIREVQTRIDQVAHDPDTTALITGQNGTGKELVARCIHERGARLHGPFVAINCAALTESLLEAELFGYESGAFNGASREGKDGLFTVAAGGTLFLDEVGQIEPALQAKLLRVLQERSFRRIGGVNDLAIDVRIIASTNQDLRELVQAGRFREDLFHRLNVMVVNVPSLRERAADVPLLSHFFVDQIGRQMGKSLSGFTEEAMETLGEYAWPGNVRELRNAIEYACIICPNGMIDEAHLPKFTGGLPDGSDEIDRTSLVLDGSDHSIRALESQLVSRVLEDTDWNISRSASILGINRTTLYNKIRGYGLGQRPMRSKLLV